jgi:hypothetical protein
MVMSSDGAPSNVTPGGRIQGRKAMENHTGDCGVTVDGMRCSAPAVPLDGAGALGLRYPGVACSQDHFRCHALWTAPVPRVVMWLGT